MGFYIYCVVPAGHAPPADLVGFGGSPVAEKVVGQLGVWTSETERPEPGAEQAKTHNRVVEAAVRGEVTPVPLRFGQWSADFAVFEKAIAEKAAWYAERLRTFHDALEFGVRILSPEREPARHLRTTESVTGLEYMKGLRQRAEAAQAERDEVQRICAAVNEILGAYVREQKIEQPRTAHGMINIVHLVARENFGAYREGAPILRARFPALRFLLSGPWVPYSFAQ